MRISLALSLMLSSTLFPSMVEAGRAAGEYEIIQPNSLASAMMMGLINQGEWQIQGKQRRDAARVTVEMKRMLQV